MSRSTDEVLQATSLVIAECRFLDWIMLDCGISDSSVEDVCDRLKAAWLKPLTSDINRVCGAQLSKVVWEWAKPRGALEQLADLPGIELMKTQYQIYVQLAVGYMAEDVLANRSPHDKYRAQIDFLLQSMGLVKAREMSWGQKLKTSTTSWAPAIASTAAAIFNPLIGVALSVLKASSEAKTIASKSVPVGEEVQRNAYFHEFLQLLYSGPVAMLPVSFQNRIAELDGTIRRMIQKDGGDDWIMLLRRRQTVLLAGGLSAVGSQATAVEALFGGDDEADITIRTTAMLEEYSHLPQLDRIVNMIRENSTSANPRRIQLHLHGDPGTGKTRFVNSLATALGLPIHHLRINTADDFQLLCALPGQHRSAAYLWSSPDASDEFTMSTIPYALAKTGVSNPILFIDEASSLLSGSLGSSISSFSVLDSLKVLFDDNMAEIAAPMMTANAKFDYSRFTVIIATTSSMGEANVDRALANRFLSLPFAPLDDRVRQRALYESLASLESYRLTTAQNRDAADLARQFIPFIVRTSATRGHTGGRTLQRVMWAVHAECVRDIAKGDRRRAVNWNRGIQEMIEFWLPPMNLSEAARRVGSIPDTTTDIPTGHEAHAVNPEYEHRSTAPTAPIEREAEDVREAPGAPQSLSPVLRRLWMSVLERELHEEDFRAYGVRDLVRLAQGDGDPARWQGSDRSEIVQEIRRIGMREMLMLTQEPHRGT